MLERLPESRPARRRSTSQLALSASLHATVLFLAITATRGVAAPRDDRRPPPASFVVGVAPAAPRTVNAATGPSAHLIAPDPFSALSADEPGVPDLAHALPQPRLGSSGAANAGAWSVPAPPALAPVQGPIGPRRMVDEPVVAIEGPRPEYPPALRAAGVEGTVRVRFIVAADGTVDTTRISVVRSSHQGFERAATEVIARWRYRPARLDGVPVAQVVELNVRFRIED